MALALVSLSLNACVSSGGKSAEPDHLNRYSDGLRTTAKPALRPGSAGERAAIKSFSDFFSELTEERAKALTKKVYAPDAYFNDTLKTLHGSDAIEGYFVRTARNVETMTVQIEDVAHSGPDYYFRWVMDVRFRKLKAGETVRTIGVTQIRFDRQGRVILHQDFWDSAAGLWDHAPFIGGFLRSIKRDL